MIRVSSQALTLFARRYSQYQKCRSSVFLRQVASLSTMARAQHGVKSFDEIPKAGMVESITTFIRKGGMKNLYEIQREQFERLGPIYKGELFGKQIVHVADAEANAHILQTEGTFPLREFIDIDQINDTQLYSMFGKDYERWKAARSPIAPTFLRPVEVQKFAPGVNDIAEDAVKRLRRELKAGRVANLKFELDGYSTENILLLVYGLRMGFYDDPPNPKVIEFIQNTYAFSEAVVSLGAGLPLWRYVTTPAYRKLAQAKEKLFSTAEEFAEMREKKQQSEDNCLYTKIAEKCNHNVNHLAIALGQAGVETTSTALTWCLYHLSTNPQAQEKAYAEIVSATTTNDKSSEAQQFYSRLPYLKACIKESSRLVPVVSLLTRTLDKDTLIHGYKVPADSIVCMWFRYSGNSAKNFSKPEQFDPQRWIRAERQEKSHPFAHLPFGFGVRKCLGSRFADLELAIGLARIVQNFHLEYVGEDSTKPIFKVGINFPEMELPIKFIERV